jgi:hypothetical protein
LRTQAVPHLQRQDRMWVLLARVPWPHPEVSAMGSALRLEAIMFITVAPTGNFWYVALPQREHMDSLAAAVSVAALTTVN